MSPTEIRAIRGALSSAAFARLLGVTSLTVLRWELPEDSKEARRPRAPMIEALRRVAAEGAATSAPPRDGDVDEDEDEDGDEDGASEPASASARVGSHRGDALPADAARVQELLARFAREGPRLLRPGRPLAKHGRRPSKPTAGS